MSKNKMSGAEIIIEALKNEGVETVFGYPGGAILPLYDALFQQKDIKHIFQSMSRQQLILQKAMPDQLVRLV